ncbi:ABC-2 type transport system ATP-binding protein [Thermodesulfobium acidiphilum]|uniref:ABC-2 type transport system ATP-binding protein n=1 Tax=Thermodesulfobium acidiphilum TaxID=1794699 RepID=A0A2R4W1U2_THEAF|nr:ABC transporter ATP-binding protein [Thermodesulfobium acidiphilum]AWB10668.1 ABC-2 type transport system ATP-binding protein [Thermodesulfobium acidiphilum]
MKAIRVLGLTKSYKSETNIVAVNNLSFEVEEGQVFCLLGPNGAGKTTTIRILNTLLKKDKGQIYFFNIDLDKKPQDIKNIIGVVQQHTNVDSELTVWENLLIHSMLHKMNKMLFKERANQLLEAIDMIDKKNRFANKLSGGERRKLSIIRALLHNPKIIFLDEPTVGLDTFTRRSIWENIKQLKYSGKTIILTTHYIEEAQMLSDLVLIINKGKKLIEETPNTLINRLGKVTLEYQENGKTIYKFFNTNQEAKDFSVNLKDLNSILIRETNLEDVFVTMTGNGGEDYCNSLEKCFP